MKKILITGGAGYIGSHTAIFLEKRGYEVAVYDSLEKGHAQSIPKRTPLIIGDISDSELLDKTFKEFKPDTVMHFAGYTEVEESMKYPKKYFKNNLVNSINLVKAMKKAEVNKIIFSSTAAVYGTPDRIPITEDMKPDPVNNYGLSKLLFENYLDICEEINSVCLRYFNAAGAGYGIGESHKPETHLIPLAIKSAQGQGEVNIFGTDYDTPDGTCIRDYVHVLDLANAHALALDTVEERSEKYNLGTGKGYSVNEVINAIERISGKEVAKKTCERRPGDPPVLIASAEKIKKELGWEPERGLDKIIESAWTWHSKNPNGF
ncbi:MAG: UDP-glucose 4-epimerase GalE [archaeon]